jgi:hypothetical protein
MIKKNKKPPPVKMGQSDYDETKTLLAQAGLNAPSSMTANCQPRTNNQ